MAPPPGDEPPPPGDEPPAAAFVDALTDAELSALVLDGVPPPHLAIPGVPPHQPAPPAPGAAGNATEATAAEADGPARPSEADAGPFLGLPDEPGHEEIEAVPAALASPPVDTPVPAPTSSPAADTALVMRAVDDPEVRELVLIRGRRPRVRTVQGWLEMAFEVGPDEWDAVHDAVAERTGHPRVAGHGTHQGPGGMVIETMTPPLAADPVIHLRRRPPRAGLDAWIRDGLIEGDTEALREALRSHRGVLVTGERASGRTALLEALADSTPPGARIATLETLPQLRLAGALRLRLDPAGPGAALNAARASTADWVVIDDAPPTVIGAAIVETGGGATLLATARTVDADAWLSLAAGSIAHEVGDPEAAVRQALPVVIRVESSAGYPRARVIRS